MQHPDEGTIHAWLDGQLPPADAAATATHVEACAECSALVAEARGLIAASSRIVGALDDVPGGVIPSSTDELARKRAERSGASGRPRARTWWRHPGFAAAAALVVVAIGSYRVLTRVSAAGALRDAEPRAASVARGDSVAPVAAQSAPVSPPATTGANRSNPTVADAPVRSVTPRRDRAADSAQDFRRLPEGRQALAATEAGSSVAAAGADSLTARRVRQESARLQEVVTTGAAAPTPAPRPATAEREAKARADVAQRSAAIIPLSSVTVGATKADARNMLASKEEPATQIAPACYALVRVAAGGGPLAIAAPHVPTRVQLDTTVATAVVDPPQYSARDVDTDSTMARAVLRWSVAAGGFDLFVERGGTTTRVAVLLGNDQTLARQRATPQPAGASVLVRATAVPCANR